MGTKIKLVFSGVRWGKIHIAVLNIGFLVSFLLIGTGWKNNRKIIIGSGLRLEPWECGDCVCMVQLKRMGMVWYGMDLVAYR
jgi:hypothetical protein